MKQKMAAIIRKDLRNITANKNLFLSLLILPVFFMIIPVMAASIMSASAFVGEKEKHTLETLLYCRLSVKQAYLLL